MSSLLAAGFVRLRLFSKLLAVAVFALLGFQTGTAQTTYSITTFNASPVSKAYTEVAGINSSGYVVGSVQWNGGYYEVGFVRHLDGSFAYFSPPRETLERSYAYGISDDGTVVGDYWLNSAVIGFIRTAAGAITTYQVTGAQATAI